MKIAAYTRVTIGMSKGEACSRKSKLFDEEEKLGRATGFEPVTSSATNWRSTE